MVPEIDQKLESRYRSRKFMLSAISVFLSAAALFSGFIEGSQFIDIIPMILAIYGAGNVAEVYTAHKGK